MRIFNSLSPAPASGTKLGALFAIRNEAKTDEPLEILVYETIGKDPWTGEGMDCKGMLAKLDGIKADRELKFRFNSRGGDVFEGLAMYNRIREWAGKTVAIIDGVAASIASVIAMGCDEVQMPKASQMFIHDAWGFVSGNAADMRDMAQKLDTSSNQLAGIYAEKTGKSVEEMRQMMKDSKLMTGKECKDLGFADTLLDADPIYNFSPEDITTIKAMCRTGQPKTGAPNPPPNPNQNLMKRDQIIALLKARGQEVADNATDEQLLNMLNAMLDKPAKKEEPQQNADVAALQASVQALLAQNARERKDRIERAVAQCVIEDRIPGSQQEYWVGEALKNESILAQLAAMPQKPAGVAPLSPNIKADASVSDKAKHFAKLQGLSRGQFFMANRDTLLEFAAAPEMARIMNAAGDNTIAAGLQRQVILQEGARAFAAAILPVRAFSTVFENVMLEGTDKVNVPFYDLETAASTDWNAANGYVAGETNTDTREVTVNKRKYQPFSFSSSVLARQPFYSVLKLMQIKAEKLGVDVFKDILSVVTLANYGAAVVAEAADAFDSDDVATIRGACNTASWPEVGRSLILDSDYDTALVKDDAIKSNASFAGNVAQTGKIPRLMGFDYYQTPNIPDNSQNLKGMAVFPSAILVAVSPIKPAPGVMKKLVSYEVIVDPTTGIAFEYRYFGDDQKDKDMEVVEANYGYVKGNASALKRITS